LVKKKLFACFPTNCRFREIEIGTTSHPFFFFQTIAKEEGLKFKYLSDKGCPKSLQALFTPTNKITKSEKKQKNKCLFLALQFWANLP
jgi:hypothetical protein